MDTVPVDVAGFIEPGKPLIPSEAVVSLPADAIELETEVVYRFLTDYGHIPAGTYVVAELRDCAHSGELIVARDGEDVYVGWWWAKHGLVELRDNAGNTLLSNPVILASINHIIAITARR
ncbi:MAG TPA: hypothetical protein VE974_06005 [Thermoanaerobaculia bacterium]|nr:hypothetical protein [Thermoanaerobaculia bacterium]